MSLILKKNEKKMKGIFFYFLLLPTRTPTQKIKALNLFENANWPRFPKRHSQRPMPRWLKEDSQEMKSALIEFIEWKMKIPWKLIMSWIVKKVV